MNSINKYLKIAKDAVIEPEDRIEEKIMDRISHIEEEEKDRMLDKNFLDFLKKSNSRVYQLEQKLKDHPGVFALISIFVMGIIAVLAYIARLILTEESK
jgi:hypothetical protein